MATLCAILFMFVAMIKTTDANPLDVDTCREALEREWYRSTGDRRSPEQVIGQLLVYMNDFGAKGCSDARTLSTDAGCKELGGRVKADGEILLTGICGEAVNAVRLASCQPNPQEDEAIEESCTTVRSFLQTISPLINGPT